MSKNNDKLQASWVGYSSEYINDVIGISIKSLATLAKMTVDPNLLFWISGLKTHLEKIKGKNYVKKKYNG